MVAGHPRGEYGLNILSRIGLGFKVYGFKHWVRGDGPEDHGSQKNQVVTERI